MKIIYIRYGYRISDTDAGKLARAVGRGLPRWGHELSVAMPGGEPAVLARMRTISLPPDPNNELPSALSKRGWIWWVASSQDLSGYTRQPLKSSKVALTKARKAAAWGKALEKAAHEGFEVDRARMLKEAARAYLVAGDAFEDASDMLLAMRYRKNAEKLMSTRHGFSGELERDPSFSRLSKRLSRKELGLTRKRFVKRRKKR